MSNTTPTVEHREFQAEVKQLLDIVIHSLYTDREIFVRELVSNAADALEKLRHTQLTESAVYEPSLALEIHITANEEAKTLTIADHGIGMTREELVENLGTIAHSGSKTFMKALKASGKEGTQLIGQFGVGFYSAFMVADKVDVHTHSWREDGEHLCWTSDGATGYGIEPTEDETRGSRIVLHLKEDATEFAKPERIKEILAKYSNFVGFPIILNGDRVNNVEAVWLKNKSDVTEEQYNEFYKFTAKAFDDPSYTFHFSADAPLVINALLFAPTQNMEMYGMGQMEAGVALYCKKVLIDPNPPKLLPEWMRFLRGVIDSEDLPLNISRESMQDSALIRKLGTVVVKRFLKFLDSEATDNAEKYSEFYKNFSRFIKEGAATDTDNREAVAKLLRFESSMTEAGKHTSLADYVTRMKDGQKAIYYQVAPSRGAIESGPYVEAFKSRGFEVLFLLEPIDDYVVSAMREFDGKPLQSLNSDKVELDETPAEEGESLSTEDSDTLCTWLKESLGKRVENVRTGKRLVSSPAIALLPEGEMTPQMRQMMRALRKDDELSAPEVILEINPRSALIRNLAGLKDKDADTAGLIAQQLLDNTLLSAGLIEDPQPVITRSLQIMEKLAAKLN
ncbi:MAG: Heat shock protein Hsp90-like protein [Verrucomicrobiaceae bacterium]|nr:Heat shock protein Hsp90-like protein [Verrucomicrobiaceae bacterium]